MGGGEGTQFLLFSFIFLNTSLLWSQEVKRMDRDLYNCLIEVGDKEPNFSLHFDLTNRTKWRNTVLTVPEFKCKKKFEEKKIIIAPSLNHGSSAAVNVRPSG